MQMNESYELVSKKSLPFPKNYAKNSEEAGKFSDHDFQRSERI